MSETRYFKTKFWEDEYIESLEPLEKLLFVYFITAPKSNLLGIYDISKKRISNDTGLDLAFIDRTMARFEKDRKICYHCGYVVLVNFLKNQRMNKNMWSGAMTLFRSLPEAVRMFAEPLIGIEVTPAPVKKTIAKRTEVATTEPEPTEQPQMELTDDPQPMEFEEFEKEMRGSCQFLDQIAMQLSLDPETVTKYLNTFINERKLLEDWNYKTVNGRQVFKSFQDNRSHFFNWIKLKQNGTGKNETPGVAVMPEMRERKRK